MKDPGSMIGELHKIMAINWFPILFITKQMGNYAKWSTSFREVLVVLLKIQEEGVKREKGFHTKYQSDANLC